MACLCVSVTENKQKPEKLKMKIWNSAVRDCQALGWEEDYDYPPFSTEVNIHGKRPCPTTDNRYHPWEQFIPYNSYHHGKTPSLTTAVIHGKTPSLTTVTNPRKSLSFALTTWGFLECLPLNFNRHVSNIRIQIVFSCYTFIHVRYLKDWRIPYKHLFSVN